MQNANDFVQDLQRKLENAEAKNHELDRNLAQAETVMQLTAAVAKSLPNMAPLGVIAEETVNVLKAHRDGHRLYLDSLRAAKSRVEAAVAETLTTEEGKKLWA